MFRKFITRNIIAFTIPVLIIEFFILIIAVNLSVLDEYSSYEITYSDLSELETKLNDSYLGGKVNVTFLSPEKMIPAGYDYRQEDGKKGICYYDFLGDSIRFYILNDESSEKIKNGERAYITARLEKKQSLTKTVSDNYESKLALTSGTMDNYVESIYVNEINYPIVRLEIIKWAKKLSVILMIASVVYLVVALAFPSLNFCYKIVGGKDGHSRGELIRLVNEELADGDSIDFENGYYQTEHFLVSNYVSYTQLEIITDDE